MNRALKERLKMVYYSNFGHVVRFLPEHLKYEIRYKEFKQSVKAIENQSFDETIKVVFLLEFPEMWNSCKSVFEAMQQSENVEPYLIVLPKYPDLNNYPAFEFAKSIEGNVIEGFNSSTREWFDISELKPNYVFYSRPYAKEYPNAYKPCNLSKYAKLCYIPYGFEFIKGYHIEVEYNLDFFPYVYMLFFEGQTSRAYCETFCKNRNDKKLFEVGYPKFDLTYKTRREFPHENVARTFLWTPRWSVETMANDGTSYFELIEPLISYFTDEKHKDLNLIIRPHPLMFTNFIKNGIMSKGSVEELFHRIDCIPNISFDKNSDYLKSISVADYVISDFTSMLVEYVLFDLPILYCGKSDKFDSTGKQLDSVMYHISDYKSVEDALDDFIARGDIFKSKRKTVLDKLSNGFDGKIGERIANAIISDYNSAISKS